MTELAPHRSWWSLTYVVLYCATLANLVLAASALITGYHGWTGQLQAQEDFEAAMFLFAIGVPASLVALITFVLHMLQPRDCRSITVAVWALANVVSPLVFFYVMVWLVRA